MENPLLSIRFAVPFGTLSAEHVRPAFDELLARGRRALDAIAAAPPSYDNTLAALERATEPLEWAMNVVGHLESVATTPALREAYNTVEPEVSAFFASIPLHQGLWNALAAFAKTPEAAALDPVRRRFLDKTLADFRRNGAELPAAGKARLEAISRELATATTVFSQHVLDSTSAWELVIEDERRLAGLPDSAKQAARASAAAKGVEGFRLTLHAPSLIPALTYADDPSLREQLWRANNTRATQGELDNRPLITRILDLRREKAALLGYADFSDLVLEDRMAKRGARAAEFVRDLEERTRPHFERENEELLAFRREQGDPGEMKPWDVAYWAEKLRQARFDFDEETLRPYLPLESVLKGLFTLCERLFGIAVRPAALPVWHPDVRAYEIVDSGGGHLCSFYADLFPRDDKRGGAWMNGVITGTDGAPHLGLICANVTPAVGDRPALLSFREAETIFHEFGHLLHHALSRVPVRSLAGTSVAWDFVELPSQIMENWCWERESLDLLARHHETGAPIPQELFDRMKRARTFRAANAQMRQLGFASVDLALHREYLPARDGDPLAYARRILARFSAVPVPDDYAMIAGFTHLFGSPVGYAAGYYSYKWAEVLDADAFTRFNGIDPRVGAEFRDRILSRGDSRDPMELYREFMGREPSLDALLKRAGLAA